MQSSVAGDQDTLISIEKLLGSSANDTLKLNALSASILSDTITKQGGLIEVNLAAEASTGGLGGDVLDMSGLSEAVDLTASNLSATVSAKAQSTRSITVVNAEQIIGTAYNDVLTLGSTVTRGMIVEGGAGDDRITAGAGSDLISGGAGNDVIHMTAASTTTVKFGVGDGKDVVRYAPGQAGYDFVFDGLNVNDITIIVGGADNSYLAHDDIHWDDIQSLVFRITSTGESITVAQDNADIGSLSAFDDAKNGVDYASLHNPVRSVVFGGGVTWTSGDLWSYLEGHSSHSNVTSDLATRSGITVGTLFPGPRSAPAAYLSHINNDYFVADPVSPTPKSVSGTAGDDNLADDSGDDLVAGGGGDDYIGLSAGDDTVLWNVGDGNDTVFGVSAFNGNDVIKIGAGITRSDLRFNVDNDGNILMNFGNVAGSVLLGEQFYAKEGSGQTSVKLADGFVLDHTALKATTEASLPANHVTISGTSGDDFAFLPRMNFSYSGLGGNDYISVSSEGFGEFRFSKNDGNDTFSGSADRQDTLFLTDSTPAEVTLTVSEASGPFGDPNCKSVVVSIGPAGTFTIEKQISSVATQSPRGISTIRFADGTVWDRAMIEMAANTSGNGGATEGDDVIDGTPLDDQLTGLGGNDTLRGIDGNDTLDSGGGNDRLEGGNGDDVLQGGGGNDIVEGGTGNDIVRFSNNDTGFDSIDGGPGTDRIEAFASDTVIGMRSITGIETITAASFTGVTIAGSADADVLNFTGVTLTGIDRINAGAGADTVTGSAGNDIIEGGAGNDSLAGGAGNDIFVYSGSFSGLDAVDGGIGTDTIRAEAADTIIGLYSTNAETITADGFANVSIVSSSGNDVFNFSGVALIGITKIDVGDGNDTVVGSNAADTIYGGAGLDTLSGGSGSNALYGGADGDLLTGGGSDDIVAGGDGDDTIYVSGGASGFDAVDGGAGLDKIQALAVNTIIGLSTVSGVETITAGGYAGVSILGSLAGDILGFSSTSLIGISKIDGGSGNDVITGSTRQT